MRHLYVNGGYFEITDEKAEKLLKSDAIYPCGEEHDLHLNPEHEFSLLEVETLMNANEE